MAYPFREEQVLTGEPAWNGQKPGLLVD